MSKKTLLVIGLVVVALVGIPAALLVSQQTQNIRSKASGSTTLAITPGTTESTPLQKGIGETASFEVWVKPGDNMPSMIKMEINYDATYFENTPNTFTVNNEAFPVTVEGPVVTDGKILVAVSIGSDSTKAIQKETKVGTLTLKTKAVTSSPTKISLGTISEVLSVATTDQAAENVLATTLPAFVIVAEAPTPTATTLTFTAFLHGIGKSGDNANPSAHSMSNKNPLHESRQIFIEVINDQNIVTATKAGILTYNKDNGNFTGTFDFGQSLPEGDYIIKLKEPTHLRKLVDGIIYIKPQQSNQIPEVAFVAGDVNNDNTLNILDYNIISGCYSDLLPAVACDDLKKEISDLNDDGKVNQYDYNLFLREIIVQYGG